MMNCCFSQMPQKVSLIKWSNSFPGIISIVYAEHPAMVLYVEKMILTYL